MAKSKLATQQTEATHPPETVVIDGRLDDIQAHRDRFDGLPAGRYVMQFVTAHSSQSLSVLWDGEGTLTL